MTREEAIANLEDILEESTRHEDSVCYVTGEDAETLKIAISALQQVVKDTNVPCTDTISRQAAIDALKMDISIIPFAKAREYVRAAIETIYNRLKKLQPAQPEPIRINLNEPIKVKLTDWGKEIYYHQHDRTNQIAGIEICKPNFPKEDENGYTEFQLWCFIELYGEHMGPTLPNVIKPNEIVYERRE